MGSKKVILFVCFFFAVVVLYSSEAAAGRVLAQNSNTVDASQAMKTIGYKPLRPKPVCNPNKPYGSCVPPSKRRPCNYKKACKRPPAQAQP